MSIESAIKAIHAAGLSYTNGETILANDQLRRIVELSQKMKFGPWRPIEEAPKDKKMIVVIAVWGSYTTDIYGVFWCDNEWARWPHAAPPTHFLEVPSLPEENV